MHNENGVAPIAVLFAWRTSATLGVESLRPPDVSGLRWLAQRFTSTELLLPALQHLRPDVLLLEQEIFNELSREALVSMQVRCAGLRVLLIASIPSPDLHEKVLRCHFHGVLPADCESRECLNAIRAICQGEIWFPRAVLSRVVAQMMDTRTLGDKLPPDQPLKAPKAAGGRLSRRERQIVELVRRGMTNKEIARNLYIMEDTVKKHLQNVFGKLGVRRRTLVALNPISRFS